MTPCFLKNVYFENSVIWLTLLWNWPVVSFLCAEKMLFETFSLQHTCLEILITFLTKLGSKFYCSELVFENILDRIFKHSYIKMYWDKYWYQLRDGSDSMVQRTFYLKLYELFRKHWNIIHFLNMIFLSPLSPKKENKIRFSTRIWFCERMLKFIYLTIYLSACHFTGIWIGYPRYN